MRKENYPIIQTSKFRELDFYSESALKFQSQWDFVMTYRIDQGDLGRPDRIASRTFPQQIDAHEYWWVILIANNIQDPFNDLKVGVSLKIPSIVSIKQFVAFAKNEAKNYGVSVNADTSKGWMVI